MNARSTHVHHEGVTIMGGILLAVVLALPVWGAIALTAWLVTR